MSFALTSRCSTRRGDLRPGPAHRHAPRRRLDGAVHPGPRDAPRPVRLHPERQEEAVQCVFSSLSSSSTRAGATTSALAVERGVRRSRYACGPNSSLTKSSTHLLRTQSLSARARAASSRTTSSSSSSSRACRSAARARRATETTTAGGASLLSSSRRLRTRRRVRLLVVALVVAGPHHRVRPTSAR